jgi:HPt (histidine-containing phosphotransfer) domain-containing protein
MPPGAGITYTYCDDATKASPDAIPWDFGLMDPVIDRERLQEVLDEVPGILDSLSAALEVDAPRQVALMRAAIPAGDAGGLAAAAHRLRGSVGCFYATACLDAAGVLEETGRAGNLAGSEEALRNLERELERLWSELDRIREELRP